MLFLGSNFHYVTYPVAPNGDLNFVAILKYKLSAEEQSECEERMRERARGERGNEVNRDYASGIAGLLFAILVWITHFMWSRRIK